MQERLLVLGLLKLQDMHGYQLSDLIDKRLKYLTDLKKPTLYHLLGRLEAEGLVTKTASREGNRPERFTYRLTPGGAEQFHELLQVNLQDAPNAYFADDIGLLFLSEIPAEDARASLTQKRMRVDERTRGMEHALEQHSPGTPAYYTLHHQLAHLQAERAWLDGLLSDLTGRAVKDDILKCLEAEGGKPPAVTLRRAARISKAKKKTKNKARTKIQSRRQV